MSTRPSPFGSQKAVLYFKGHPEFKGSGTLNVTGLLGHAISAKEEMQLKPSLGIINILGAVKDGLHCGRDVNDAEHNYFEMKGGIVNITNISGGTIDILTTGGDLITATSRASAAVPDASAVVPDASAAVPDASPSGLADTTKCMGISVDADLLQTGGDVCLTANGTEAKTYNVKGTETHSGGTFVLRQAPWQFNAVDYRYDMSVYAVVNKNGQPLDSYDNVAVGAFINDDCVGIAQSSMFNVQSSVGGDLQFPTFLLRVYSNSTTAQAVTFRLYSYDEKREYTLTPAKDVTFYESSAAWLPDNPLVLSYTPSGSPEGGENGDVNGDGHVDIADLLLVFKAIEGETIPAADIDGDGIVSHKDATALVILIKEGVSK